MREPTTTPHPEASGPVPDDVARLLRGLPEWFGIDEAIDAYVEAARELPTYVIRSLDGDPGRTAGAGRVLGVCLVEEHNPLSAEIHLLAVERAHHRHGLGRALLARVERDQAAAGRTMLQVKTLGASHPSPEYAATRWFYEALGYVALQEFPADELWPGNPCLIMVKPLAAATTDDDPS